MKITQHYQCDCPHSNYAFNALLADEANARCNDCKSRLRWVREVVSGRHVVDPDAVPEEADTQPDLFEIMDKDTGYDRLPL